MNYKVPEMSFKDHDGNLIVLKGINTYPKQVVFAHSMRSILRHGDIEWDDEFLITTQGTTLYIDKYLE